MSDEVGLLHLSPLSFVGRVCVSVRFIHHLPLFLVIPFGKVPDRVPLPEQMLSRPACARAPGWGRDVAGPGWAEHHVGLPSKHISGQQLSLNKSSSMASPFGRGRNYF